MRHGVWNVRARVAARCSSTTSPGSIGPAPLDSGIRLIGFTAISAQPVAPQLVVQRGAVDVQNPRRAREAVLCLAQYAFDVHPLHIVQRLAALRLVHLELE